MPPLFCILSANQISVDQHRLYNLCLPIAFSGRRVKVREDLLSSRRDIIRSAVCGDLSPDAERCRSGRTGRSRKPLCSREHPGFESLSLRHFQLTLQNSLGILIAGFGVLQNVKFFVLYLWSPCGNPTFWTRLRKVEGFLIDWLYQGDPMKHGTRPAFTSECLRETTLRAITALQRLHQAAANNYYRPEFRCSRQAALTSARNFSTSPRRVSD